MNKQELIGVLNNHGYDYVEGAGLILRSSKKKLSIEKFFKNFPSIRKLDMTQHEVELLFATSYGAVGSAKGKYCVELSRATRGASAELLSDKPETTPRPRKSAPLPDPTRRLPGRVEDFFIDRLEWPESFQIQNHHVELCVRSDTTHWNRLIMRFGAEELAMLESYLGAPATLTRRDDAARAARSVERSAAQARALMAQASEIFASIGDIAASHRISELFSDKIKMRKVQESLTDKLTKDNDKIIKKMNLSISRLEEENEKLKQRIEQANEQTSNIAQENIVKDKDKTIKNMNLSIIRIENENEELKQRIEQARKIYEMKKELQEENEKLKLMLKNLGVNELPITVRSSTDNDLTINNQDVSSSQSGNIPVPDLKNPMMTELSTPSKNNIDHTRSYAHTFREHGRFGSHPSHDDFGDESVP